MPFKFTGDEQVLQEMGLHNVDDVLAARAAAAAGDASAPRMAAPAARQLQSQSAGAFAESQALET